MADIFISYARADRDKVEKLAAALEAEGYSVWWDRNIVGGDDFSADIERELDAAKAVIVGWSHAGSKSKWVKDEASIAADTGKMIAVSLDGADPPIGFRQYHCLGLKDWNGAAGDDAFSDVARAAATRVNGEAFTPVPASAAPSRGGAAHKWRRGSMVGGVAALLFLIACGLIFVAMKNSGAPDDPPVEAAANGVGLAVLPFVNLSSDPEQEYFVDGLTEELLDWLAKIDGLNVPGRTTSFQFKGYADDLRDIGQRLGVQYLLEGSVRKSGDTLRITAQLIEAENGFHLWSETYDRQLDDIFIIQDNIAERVVTALLGEIALPENIAIAGLRNVDPKAHELYLKGRGLWTSRNPQAVASFRAATEIDPDHYLAQAYLAVALAMEFRNSARNDTQAEMNAALAKAVALRPDNSDVLFAEGWVTEMSSRALDGRTLRLTQMREDAAAFYERAYHANPRNVEALFAMARNSDDDDDLIAYQEKILDVDPGFVRARYNLLSRYIERGDSARVQRMIAGLQLYSPGEPVWPVLRALKFSEYFDMFATTAFASFAEQPDFKTTMLVAALLADLGALEEADYLMRTAADPQSRDGAYAAFNRAELAGETAKALEIARAAYDAAQGAGPTTGILAFAHLNHGDAQTAFELLANRRPELKTLTSAQTPPPIEHPAHGMAGDIETYIAALALEQLGRRDEAAVIWRAARDAMVPIDNHYWVLPLSRAVASGWLGDTEAAIAELDRAYALGFRAPPNLFLR